MSTYCSSREDCIAFCKDDAECQKEQGCFTKENVRNYLEWCNRTIERQIQEEKEGSVCDSKDVLE